MHQNVFYHILAMGLVYQCRGEELLSALDFSLDGDWEQDADGEYTHASLQLENFPSSFTLCAAFMVEYWKGALNPPLILLRDDDQNQTLLYAGLYAASDSETLITIRMSSKSMEQSFPSAFFPMQWSRICFSYNSNTSEANLVFNGEEQRLKTWDVNNQTSDVTLLLGLDNNNESPGQITNVNIFSNPSLNREEMTRPGFKSCGAPGDFLSWKDATWSLHSKARTIEVDSSRGPCRRESKLQVYPMEYDTHHRDCMQLCEKLGGRSPSIVRTEDLENFSEEVRLLEDLPLPYLWLSATEGDRDLGLYTLDHWPKSSKAMEGVWRDYYTGEELDNFTKPWDTVFEDKLYGPGSNCIQLTLDSELSSSWTEWQCIVSGNDIGCPCTYHTPPILTLRGLCPHTDMDETYTPMRLSNDQANITIMGLTSSYIDYNTTLSQWVLKDNYDVTATIDASQSSLALGKHNWTIARDSVACSKETSYTIEMKLSACYEEEFTCDDGQCVRIDQRCNQLLNCRDASDEKGCKILLLRNGYNKQVPPLTLVDKVQDLIQPVNLDVSIGLTKVVSMKEEDHSIEFKFEIALKWKENRVIYHKDMYLNTLSMDDMNKIWLPLVVYTNTDQGETTRLGENWEWTTNVWVKREGNFTISDRHAIDEIAIFRGEENTLIMMQSYTHEFQCTYVLQRYPFDTQVKKYEIIELIFLPRNVRLR